MLFERPHVVAQGVGGDEPELAVLDRADPVGADQPVKDGLANPEHGHGFARPVQASTDFDGTERAPMRLAEARITLGVVAARGGDLEQAVQLGSQALSGKRKSLPSLIMASRDLTKELKDRYARERHRRLSRRTEYSHPDVRVRPVLSL